MEEKSTPIWKVSLNFGLIAGVIVIIFQLIIYLLDLKNPEDYKWINIIPYLVIIGGMIWANLTFRDVHNNGLSTYGECFKTAFFTGLFASILVSVYVFVLGSLDDSIMKEALSKAEESMYEQNLTDAQIDQAMKVSRFFVKPIISALSTLIVNVIVSAILSLVISLFTKREQ
jgi:ABC-type phosphate/phosphonate transport system permease subunit